MFNTEIADYKAQKDRAYQLLFQEKKDIEAYAIFIFLDRNNKRSRVDLAVKYGIASYHFYRGEMQKAVEVFQQDKVQEALKTSNSDLVFKTYALCMQAFTVQYRDSNPKVLKFLTQARRYADLMLVKSDEDKVLFGNENICERYIHLFVYEKKYRQAVQMTDRVLEKKPKNTIFIILQARLLIRLNEEPARIISMLHQCYLIVKKTKDYETKLTIARLLLCLGLVEIKKAQEIIDAVAADDPKNEDVKKLNFLIEVARKISQPVCKNFDELSEVLSPQFLHDSCAESMILAVVETMLTTDPEKSEKILMIMLECNENHHAARHLLEVILQERKAYAVLYKLVQDYLQSHKALPVSILIQKMYLLITCGEELKNKKILTGVREKAAELLTRCKDNAENDKRVRILFMRALEKEWSLDVTQDDLFKQLEAEYKDLLKKHPANLKQRNKMAHLYFNHGMQAECINYLKETVDKLAPGIADKKIKTSDDFFIDHQFVVACEKLAMSYSHLFDFDNAAHYAGLGNNLVEKRREDDSVDPNNPILTYGSITSAGAHINVDMLGSRRKTGLPTNYTHSRVSLAYMRANRVDPSRYQRHQPSVHVSKLVDDKGAADAKLDTIGTDAWEWDFFNEGSSASGGLSEETSEQGVQADETAAIDQYFRVENELSGYVSENKLEINSGQYALFVEKRQAASDSFDGCQYADAVQQLQAALDFLKAEVAKLEIQKPISVSFKPLHSVMSGSTAAQTPQVPKVELHEGPKKPKIGKKKQQGLKDNCKKDFAILAELCKQMQETVKAGIPDSKRITDKIAAGITTISQCQKSLENAKKAVLGLKDILGKFISASRKVKPLDEKDEDLNHLKQMQVSESGILTDSDVVDYEELGRVLQHWQNAFKTLAERHRIADKPMMEDVTTTVKEPSLFEPGEIIQFIPSLFDEAADTIQPLLQVDQHQLSTESTGETPKLPLDGIKGSDLPTQSGHDKTPAPLVVEQKAQKPNITYSKKCLFLAGIAIVASVGAGALLLNDPKNMPQLRW